MSVAYSASAAYDYRRFDTAEGPVWRNEEAVAGQTAVRPVSRRAIILRRAIVLTIAVLAAAVCIGLLYVKAMVFKAQREVNDIREEITTAQKLGSTLSEQLNQATNVNTIMERAAALGMGYPEGDQVLYVSLAESSPDVKMKK